MDKNATIRINPEVATVFDSYPQKIKTKLLFLRQLIFETATSLEGIGELEETLKWGEPSYLTPRTKSGSTIRIGREKKTEADFAIYFKCRTSLVASFRERYENVFRFEGNRAILFNVDDVIPVRELSDCIAMALTYNLNKRGGLGQSSPWAK